MTKIDGLAGLCASRLETFIFMGQKDKMHQILKMAGLTTMFVKYVCYN